MTTIVESIEVDLIDIIDNLKHMEDTETREEYIEDLLIGIGILEDIDLGIIEKPEDLLQEEKEYVEFVVTHWRFYFD